jgi:hypothetical protein
MNAPQFSRFPSGMRQSVAHGHLSATSPFAARLRCYPTDKNDFTYGACHRCRYSFFVVQVPDISLRRWIPVWTGLDRLPCPGDWDAVALLG